MVLYKFMEASGVVFLAHHLAFLIPFLAFLIVDIFAKISQWTVNCLVFFTPSAQSSAQLNSHLSSSVQLSVCFKNIVLIHHILLLTCSFIFYHLTGFQVIYQLSSFT